jgi:transposase
MSVHRSVRLGAGGRRRIVDAVEGGMSQKRAAARFCVSPATVNRWVVRARQASPGERASGACFADRPCRPHSSPRMLSAADHDRVCAVRQRTGWGPRLIASELGLAHATVHRALRRRGCSRRPRPPRAAVQRYEWPCPGNLLHMDTKRYQRFERPGHAVTGDRTVNSRGAGHEFAHSLVDDCSRLAYTELHGRSARRHRDRLHRAGARLVSRPRHRRRAAPHRQRLVLHQEQATARTAAPARHRTQAHPPLQPQHQRQGRALPTDDGPRVGPRPHLQQLRRPSRRAATLAPPLQHPQTPQRDRQPATAHPRSRRPGHDS